MQPTMRYLWCITLKYCLPLVLIRIQKHAEIKFSVYFNIEMLKFSIRMFFAHPNVSGLWQTVSMFIAEDLTEIVQKLHFRIFFNIVSRFLFYLMRMRLRQRKLIGFVTTFSSWIRYDETSTVRLTVQNVNILKCWTLKTIEYKLSRFHSCWRNECFEMFTLEFELKFTLEFEI